MQRIDVASLFALAALWGASYLFMRLGAAEFGPVALAGGRALIAALLLGPVLLRRSARAQLRAHWRPIALVGVTSSAVPSILFGVAALSINAGLASICNAATPLFTALIGVLWLRDRLGLARAAGLAVGFAGVLWLVSTKLGGGHATAAWALAACLAATALYGWSANATKRYLSDVPPLIVTAGGQVGAALLLLGPTVALWPAATPGPRAWAALAALGVACTALAYALFFRLIARVGAGRAVTVAFLIPAFGVLWSALLLDETFTASMALGCAVILLGTGLTTGLLKLPTRRNAALENHA